jgi:hypothetical protein
MCGGNSMMIDPYAHPQHMKVVNHLLYVWSGCEKHSTWVWSLNHCRKALLRAPSSDSGFQPTSQIWTGQCGCNDMMMMTDPYAHPQHMKVVKHLLYDWSGCESIPHEFGAPTNMHNKGFIQHQAVMQDFSRLPKLGLTCVVETA